MRCCLFIVVASALYTSASSNAIFKHKYYTPRNESYNQLYVTVQYPPQIIKQPPTDELLFQVAQTNLNENDKPFVIECEAEAEPAPEYHWIKNGKKFEWPAYDDRISQQPGRGTLVISRPRDEDLGQYQCFAENEWGIATSNSVFVRKAELNSFKDEDPVTVAANEGDPFSMTCQPPDGWPKPHVYWLIQDLGGIIKSINNSRMTLDPEGNLWFSNVTRNDASDGFYYACAATSLYRKEFKMGNRISLDVISSGSSASRNKYEPKRQYLSRKNQVALRGKKIELYCIFGGTPLPEIVWMKNGMRIKSNERVTHGNYGKSLIIKQTNFEDEGTYTCEASNGVGKAATHSMDLKVMAIPYFTIEPEIQTAAEDETVEFRCEASGIPEPEIQWIHNGKPIAEAPPNPRRKVTANRIIIEKLTKKDTGNYGCNATNSLGYIYKDVYVNVRALEPEITQPPENKATIDGETIIMICKVFGAPKPEVKWIRNGLELTGGRYKTLETGDLEITNINFGDAGSYTCHAANKFGQVEASAVLVVKERTRIIETPEDYEVVAGETATFRCNAVADSNLTLQIDWLRNDEILDTETEPRFIITSDYSLSVTKTTELDSGVYTCLATTELDTRKAQATLIVQDVPNAPILKETKCLQKQARVSWQPMGDNRAPILRYAIQYNTSFTPDSWEIALPSISAAEQTYLVDMSPWANYTYRVIAWNKIGPSIPSPHSTVCTTQSDVPYKNPSNVMGNGTTPQNLVISWTVMPQIEHNAPRFMYRVYYRRDIPGQDWMRDDIHNWRTNTFVVDNQPTYQRYQIKVTAINEIGESRVVPDIVIGHSGEDQPTAAPGNFRVKALSSTTAMLTWTGVPLDTVRGELRGYKVQTWTERDGEDGMREITIAGTDSTSAVINKFVPFNKNYVRIFAFNGRFNGPPSEILSFETSEGVPGTVLSLDAYPLGCCALWLRWTKPAEPNGRLTGYRIYYQMVNGTRLGALLERQPHVLDPQATATKLASLKPETKYRVHIKATTNAGEGVNYYIEETTKASRKPDVPTFRWENVPTYNGYSTVKIIWLPNNQGYPGSHFFVIYRLYHHPHQLQTDPEFQGNEINIRGLQAGQTYEITVVAVDGKYLTKSEPQLVWTTTDGPIVEPVEGFFITGWFIGLLLAILLLILLLVLVCMVRRNRGGKYGVLERDLTGGRNEYPDGFSEYSQPLDTKSAGGRTSAASSSHHDGRHHDSDEDSMTEYQEGNTEGMNEDGSFIGQYGRKKAEPNPKAFATVV
ncbi:neuroglian-like isoform X2 [Diachasmimorpha longicaudata]|uniref:neuroglian-like isoform X2 n=1 Tax=Diachasmimorpha longicaudata TaxID=58733 RepID=UPI0030B873E0